jgi:hypothetical protein
MLDSLTATRFDRRMKTGRTGPFQLDGETAAGEPVEVVAKFTSKQLPVEGLIREAFGALLALDLGLPVPACYCVTVSPGFLASVATSDPAVGTALADAIPVGFGSAKLPPGFSAWPPRRSLPTAMRNAATEIYAFDLLIQNTDRRPENPNLQSKGNQFAIFDHEMALITEGILFWKPPWQPGALTVVGAPGRHVLYEALHGSSPDLSRLIGAWEDVDDARLASYRAALPPEWTSDPQAAHTADKAIGYLSDLRRNIRPAMQEITRTLV